MHFYGFSIRVCGLIRVWIHVIIELLNCYLVRRNWLSIEPFRAESALVTLWFSSKLPAHRMIALFDLKFMVHRHWKIELLCVDAGPSSVLRWHKMSVLIKSSLLFTSRSRCCRCINEFNLQYFIIIFGGCCVAEARRESIQMMEF